MTGSRTSFPPLVVGTDAAAVHRVYRAPLIAVSIMAIVDPIAAVALAALAASTGGVASGLIAGGAILLPGVYFILMAVYIAHVSAGRAAAGQVLRLDDTGMEWRLPQGVLVVPWGAVVSVSERRRGGHRILTYRLVDGLTPSSPGVASDVTPAIFQRLVKRGLQIGSAGIDVPVDTILAATSAFTQGRVAPR